MKSGTYSKLTLWNYLKKLICHHILKATKYGISVYSPHFLTDSSFATCRIEPLCLTKTDAKDLNEVQDRFEVDITELPEEIDLLSYIDGC